MTMLRTLRNTLSELLYHLWTIFLFTKSDIKTTIIPVTSLAVASAPLASFKHLPHVVFWIWFHVLQFNVSNQTLKPEEDEHNKPDRPLPAKRITRRNALRLHRALVPACWALSACYGVQTVYASIAFYIITFIYDTMGYAAGHWTERHLLNVLGYMSLEVGACLIAGANPHSMNNICVLSVLCSAGIVMTTTQAQDFKDTEGDRLVGRKTIPIVAPGVARPTLLLALLAWSTVLSFLWELGTGPALVFHCLALAVGGRFVVLNSIKEDQTSYLLYNVWFSFAHALPAYFRFTASAPAL